MSYLLVFFEYYKTCKKSYLIFNLTIALILSCSVYLVSKEINFDKKAETLINNISSILGILIGFSISMFTLLNTATNTNIDQIKKTETGYKLYNRPVFLFDLLIISMIYIIIFESFLLILNLLFTFFLSLNTPTGVAVFCFDIFLLIHVILVNISTTVDFYFIITKKR